MTKKESSKFKIRMDDNPDMHFQADNQGFKFDKLNRRITLITILIPCLIGAIIFLVYRDINMRVGQVSSSGTTKVKTLSKDLETSFSSLSALQKNLSQQLISLEKNTIAVDKNLKKASTAIRQIRTARKVDNRKSAKSIAAINKNLATLAPVPEELKNIASDINLVDDKFSKELENLSQSLESIKNNLIKIQADLISMASAKIDQKALDTALKNQQATYQQLLRQTINDIENKIASIESKINGGKTVKAPSGKNSSTKTATSSKGSAKAVPKSKPIEDAVKPEPSPDKNTSKSTSLPNPGTFIEQDIK